MAFSSSLNNYKGAVEIHLDNNDENMTTHPLPCAFLHCFYATLSLSLYTAARRNIRYGYNRNKGTTRGEIAKFIAIRLVLGRGSTDVWVFQVEVDGRGGT